MFTFSLFNDAAVLQPDRLCMCEEGDPRDRTEVLKARTQQYDDVRETHQVETCIDPLRTLSINKWHELAETSLCTTKVSY
jgi:hypothetical protein